MPTYSYRCIKGHEYELWRSINTSDLNSHICECGVDAVQVFSPPRLYAVGERGAKTRAVDAKEAAWSRDMPAYKRLRHEGLQPRSIDGSADMEANASSAMEINSGGRIRGSEPRIQEAMELSRSIMDGVA